MLRFVTVRCVNVNSTEALLRVLVAACVCRPVEVLPGMQGSPLSGAESRAAVLGLRRGGYPCSEGARSLLELDLQTAQRPLWTAQDLAVLEAIAGDWSSHTKHPTPHPSGPSGTLPRR